MQQELTKDKLQEIVYVTAPVELLEQTAERVELHKKLKVGFLSFFDLLQLAIFFDKRKSMVEQMLNLREKFVLFLKGITR